LIDCLIWNQEADALVSRVTKATFKSLIARSPVGYQSPKSLKGEISIVLITPHEHYCIAKVDQEDEGMRFANGWRAL